MKQRVLVTGGLGFIGSHLVDHLVQRGAQVTVVDNLSTGRLENGNPHALLIQKDILDVEAELFQDQHLVFHCAALPRIEPSFEDPMNHEKANVLATIDLLTKLRHSRQLKKLVISSSAAVYGNPSELPTPETATIDPLSPYGLQKYAAERYAMILGNRYDIPTIALRYFNVFGPRGFNPEQRDHTYATVVGLFIHQTMEGKKLTITGDGKQSRDFIHVSDVVQANLLAAESALQNQVYNVGSGRSTTILELAAIFPQETVFIPARKGEPLQSCADTHKIRHDLHWNPKIPLAEGIRRELTHAVIGGNR